MARIMGFISVMMAMLLIMMGAAPYVQLKQVGNAVVVLPQQLTPVLKFVEMVCTLVNMPVMMAISQVEMAAHLPVK